ncbi:MAG: hypothetical protein HY400_05285 [Elusimicrobia bacterium]|nr:hypothetical protein [Elusimicrobiota bacterium]
MRNFKTLIIAFFVLATLYSLLSTAFGASAGRAKNKEEALLLDLSKVRMGPLSTAEEKKRYLSTIQLEKEKIQRRMLRSIYENAYETYKDGDYEGAQELASRILSIDSTFEDASLLLQASGQLKGAPRPRLSARQFTEDKFREALKLYHERHLVEASRKWEEILKLSPGNLKARYWYLRVNHELAEEHYQRGKNAYEKGQLREALNQWYNALMLRPGYPRLSVSIGKVETQLREQEANGYLTEALNLYGQGKLKESLKALEKVLEIQPGDAKAKKLVVEVRYEIASRYVTQGRRLYKLRKYALAIKNWETAQKFGYDPRSTAQLISRGKEQMKREASVRKRRQEAQQEEESAQEKASGEAQEPVPVVPAAQVPPQQPPAGMVTEENRRASQQHYLNGVVHFQNGDFQKAREEWMLAKQLDPNHADADAGLKRIEQMVSGGP